MNVLVIVEKANMTKPSTDDSLLPKSSEFVTILRSAFNSGSHQFRNHMIIFTFREQAKIYGSGFCYTMCTSTQAVEVHERVLMSFRS